MAMLALLGCAGKDARPDAAPDAAGGHDAPGGNDGAAGAAGTPANHPDADTQVDTGGHADGAAGAAGAPVNHPDADTHVDTGSAPDVVTDPPPPANAVPTFVAVGYGGVRVRSIDLGKTWIDAQRLGGGGDDNFLLRGVAFGKGLFVALGWQVLTSPDGKTWTPRTKAAAQWMGGVRYGNGRFVAAGGYGESTYSLDGITWPKGGGRMTDAARSVAYGNGLWTASADSHVWWQTADGATWTSLGGTHVDSVVFCGTQFAESKLCATPVGRDGGRVAFGENVWVGVRNGKLERSEDGGTTWTTVAFTPSDSLEDVAFGYVAP
jgi:hypothetical protein